MEHMTKAAFYSRVSTDAQQKEGTIESQIVELKRQISAAGHVLVKEYIDDGYSGTLLDRPALEQLRQDVKSDPQTLQIRRLRFLQIGRLNCAHMKGAF